MPSNTSLGFDLSVRPGSHSAGRIESSGDSYEIIVLGDFSGRASRGVIEPVAGRKLMRIDIDNAAAVQAKWNSRLLLAGEGLPSSGVELAIASVEDFHPDRLLTQVPWLAEVNEARRLLDTPSTAEQGRALLDSCLGSVSAAPIAPPAEPANESGEDAFARLLGMESPLKAATAPASRVNDLIQKAVAAHVTQSPGEWHALAVASARAELTRRLRAVLNHPHFQALEAAWRGLDLLVRRVQTPGDINLLVLDVSLAELQAAPNDLSAVLKDRRTGLLACDFTFGESLADLLVLGAMAKAAESIGAALVATGASKLVGCDTFDRHPDPDNWTLSPEPEVAQVWEVFRQSRLAPHVALMAPRYLARHVYGEGGEEIDAFAFEELDTACAHRSFLWGHPSNLLASAVIDAVQAGDTDLADFTNGEIEDMPVCQITTDGERVVKPYAETWLSERAIQRLVSSGLMPVVPVKNDNLIRLDHLCSIAHGPVALCLAR